MIRLFKFKASAQDTEMNYAESKRLARDQDPEVRARLAVREDVRPEILYFLAEDVSAEVRRKIAANRKTPRHADLILAHDDNEGVRCQLARKIEILLPELDPEAQAQAQQYLIEVIEDRSERASTLIASQVPIKG